MGLPEPTAELSDPTANEQVDDMKTGEAEPDNEKGEVNPSFQTDDEAPPSWNTAYGPKLNRTLDKAIEWNSQ